MSGTQRVPDIVIGGAPRSGTTFLCELLTKHPEVFVARPFEPEPKVCVVPRADGDDGIRRDYERLFAAALRGAKRVEKTSYYLENAEARQRLVRVLPQAKFVFILREPVARAYSNWRWSRQNGLETLPFEEAVAQEGKRPSPLPRAQSYARPFDYLGRGRYAALAEPWIAAVGRKRIAFYILETAITEPEAFVAELQDFVGVTRLPWSQLQTGRINETAPRGGGLDPTFAAELRRRMAPEVEGFARLAGIDVSAWGY